MSEETKDASAVVLWAVSFVLVVASLAFIATSVGCAFGFVTSPETQCVGITERMMQFLITLIGAAAAAIGAKAMRSK